jgi:3-methyladenine DNA glycosylase AlkD
MPLEIQTIIAEFTHHANAELAPGMEKYMKNHFPFLGIQTPLRRQILKNIMLEYGLPDAAQFPEFAQSLYNLPFREYHYAAIDLAGKIPQKWDKNYIDLFTSLATQKSWWDSVDSIAPLTGKYFLLYPDMRDITLKSWMNSGNIWLQRLCILFQLHYKQKTDAALLFSTIAQLADSKEFFIRKAAGWALREYARTDAAAVLSFTRQYALSPLTKREALKHFK